MYASDCYTVRSLALLSTKYNVHSTFHNLPLKEGKGNKLIHFQMNFRSDKTDIMLQRLCRKQCLSFHSDEIHFYTLDFRPEYQQVRVGNFHGPTAKATGLLFISWFVVT